MLRGWLLLSVVSSVLAASPSRADTARAEAERRTDALVQEGYNLTYGWSLTSQSDEPIVLDFFVPTAGDEHLFTFWANAARGSFRFRLLGPDGKASAALSGHKGEVTFAAAAQAGKYSLTIERAAGTDGAALFGVKGDVVARCASKGGETTEHAPAAGFRWPYLLYVPTAARKGRLLVLPNNTGFHTEDLALLRASASCQISQQAKLAEKLGAPILVPLFPRPAIPSRDNLYLHALTRASLETQVAAYRRVDLQLVAMIDDARAALHAHHIDVDERVLLSGFSASGSFVNRFAFLHPDRVAAVACGSPGGWPLAPLSSIDGDELDYPVGIADVETLTGTAIDRAALARVAWFFFLGAEDRNDAVPFRDSFSAADQKLIFRRFGDRPVARWKSAERLYREAGLKARFALYPGVTHMVSADMERDLEQFLATALQER